MVALVILLTVVALSMLVTRIASVALQQTGLDRETARFQARSAFTGVGFTTREAEGVVRHPLRRRIVEILMLAGNAGLVTAVTMLILAFMQTPSARDALLRGGLLLAGLVALLLLARSEGVDRRLSRWIGRGLERFTDLGATDYFALLRLEGDYSIVHARVREDSPLAGRTLEGTDLLRDQRLVILGVERVDGSYQAVPTAEYRIEAGDALIAYGSEEGLERLRGRQTGGTAADEAGDEAGEAAAEVAHEAEGEVERDGRRADRRRRKGERKRRPA